ncbi:MAG: riboflavin biosynthesis protein RibF [Clostridia bacterium]|nr:riboflavin biosynthesis protein RibF [Clostridia bacterium]
MLKIVAFREKFNNPVVLCLGRYESLHVGHAEIISRARAVAQKQGAEVMLMTFDECDNVRNRGVILTFEERAIRAEELGVSSFLRIEFSEEFKSLSPKQFFDALVQTLNVRAFFCGFDFRFGNGRSGDPNMLTALAHQNGIPVTVVESVDGFGGKISTSAVKDQLLHGNIEVANAMLGYRYFVEGVVESGRRQGREMGFPTANLNVQNGKFCVKKGVYQTKTVVDGVEYACITNVGEAPTFGFDKIKIETYIDGFSGDLYGKTLKVEFVKFIRDVRRFSSVDELKAQLSADLASVRGKI